ncbi:MAG TPA: protein kinase [Kofleriaceae bacterium]|nr:protein kinase [Kofleriaceae bacterium]
MASVLGRYHVLKHLTSGGMAEVLLGRSDGIEGFERHVVLKRIRAEHARDKRFISMFIDEARLAAGLHHQAIVQVFDIGETNGEYFFAMEYIHGEDLRRVLSTAAKGRAHVPLAYACSIVSAVAAGLHYAHERRDSRGKPLDIVHRDVSPSNILIGYDGAVKIVDFGIAKAALRQAETVVGSLKGKTSYMSPEQCRGQSIDRRSDVYGLGVLLYELTTTSRLFKGDNDYLVMDAIVNGKFAMPQMRRPDLPNELSSIIMRALAVEPERRYQTADELRADLDNFASRYDLTTGPSQLASYMRKLFGEKPEPWLELSNADTTEEMLPPETHRSWTDLPSIEARDKRQQSLSEGRTSQQIAVDNERRRSSHHGSTESRRNSRGSVMPNVVAAVDTAQTPKFSPYDTRPSMKLGWEAESPAPAPTRSPNKLLWAAVPVLALVAFALWKLGLDKDSKQPPAAAKTTVVAMPAIPAPAPMPAAAPPPTRVVGPVVEEPAQVAAAPPMPEHKTIAKQTPTKSVEKKAEVVEKKPDTEKRVAVEKKTEPAEKIVKKTAAAEPPSIPGIASTPAPTPVAAVATAPLPVPTPAPAAAPAAVATPPAAPAITAAPAAKEIETTIPSLSNATVSAAASEHSRQLGACEGGVTLHGDVAVSFQIDGAGKVVHSQLSSTIKNPKVAACILKAVQSWKFPRPVAGAAKGVYSISYQ